MRLITPICWVVSDQHHWSCSSFYHVTLSLDLKHLFFCLIHFTSRTSFKSNIYRNTMFTSGWEELFSRLNRIASVTCNIQILLTARKNNIALWPALHRGTVTHKEWICLAKFLYFLHKLYTTFSVITCYYVIIQACYLLTEEVLPFLTGHYHI